MEKFYRISNIVNPHVKLSQDRGVTDVRSDPLIDYMGGLVSRNNLNTLQVTGPKLNSPQGVRVTGTSTNPLQGGPVSRTGLNPSLGGLVSRTGLNPPQGGQGSGPRKIHHRVVMAQKIGRATV